VVRCVRGQIRFEIECAPRVDYGRQEHQLELTGEGAVFRTPKLQLTLHGGGSGRCGITVTTSAGWREQVDRSAITLQLMTYAPTGALVAAPTAGLPELVGGERNWDYRSTWARDGSFSVHALLGLGVTEEADMGSKSATPAGSSSPSSPPDCATTGTSPRRASGTPAAAGRTSPTAEVLDASLLMMPLVGFVVPEDPMWLSTLDAMDAELVSDSLVYRYDPAASPDGLRGHEGTFSICSFWYVDALARSGRLERARLAFEKMFTYANHLGLYAEEIGLTGEQLGNFPQAFTHLSLINAAINLDRQLDHGIGRDPVLAQ
jgi:GH15 family glucan-1,4-alpha-glucosidase